MRDQKWIAGSASKNLHKQMLNDTSISDIGETLTSLHVQARPSITLPLQTNQNTVLRAN